MFDQINGLPLHVLVVHAVVVFIPLAALCAGAFVAWPGPRWLLRWPLVAVTVIAMVAVLVAVQSGLTFKSDLGINDAQINVHQSRAKVLRLLMGGFSVLALSAALMLGGSSPLRSGRGARAGFGAKPLQYAVAALLLVASVVVVVQVVRTGEAGTRSVYGTYPTGN